MADGSCTYMPEMDDVHQWLPSEVLRDIGIADPAERRRLAVVEDLATRLAGVLGGDSHTVHTRQPPSSYHHPQVRGGAGAPAPFMPLPLMNAPAAPRQAQAMAGVGVRNTMVVRPAPALHHPRHLAPALSASHPHPLFRGAVAAGAAQPVAATRRGGTGFFLPRTSNAAAIPARHHAAARAPANNVPARQCQAQRRSRGGHELAAAAAMARRQYELIEQAMTANMVQTQQLAGAPELALPQEWSY
uniref:Uncharacterized protein n=1 Tax=Leersia perrieri TaxID=77586 RepID=A0A0D9VU32_9ORYZ